jgi:hypothetical protein
MIAGIGRVAAGDFRRGIDSGRCGLARVKRDAGSCAEPVSKDAKEDCRYHSEADCCLESPQTRPPFPRP